MKNKVFTSTNGLKLIIKYRKSAVIFEMDESQMDKNRIVFKFDSKDFADLLDYIEIISNKSWTNLKPKEADSFGSDYCEYYDRKLDNNGYLSIKENTLIIERPFLKSNKLYQFNKKKMESFIYDFRELVNNKNCEVV